MNRVWPWQLLALAIFLALMAAWAWFVNWGVHSAADQLPKDVVIAIGWLFGGLIFGGNFGYALGYRRAYQEQHLVPPGWRPWQAAAKDFGKRIGIYLLFLAGLMLIVWVLVPFH